MLPERCNGSGEADRDRAVEEPDVDPELERVRRGDAEQLSLDEPTLDVAALLGRVPGAVRGEAIGGRGVHPLDGEAVDELRRLAALREADRPQAACRELREQSRRLAERARAQAEIDVEERWVPDHDLALRLRRRVEVDDRRGLTRERLRELARVRDRRGREQELRVGVVHARQPSQPAQHVGDVRAEDSSIDVRLVHDHEAEVVQHVAPAVVVREHA